ncbi:hypothetical protein ACFWP2_08315 [Kitasatospora sp. NPDC058444]
MSTPAPVHARPATTARLTQARPAEARVAPRRGTSGPPDATGAGR